MKNKIVPYLTFMTGLILSGVAAFFSIIGLTTLFSGAYWSVVVMGSTLEIAKLVSISWLYHNWNKASLSLKAYLFSAILILMLITSMGIFGYLSKAHIEQKVSLSTGLGSDITLLKNDVKIKQDAIDDLDKQLNVIDSSINKMLEKGQAKDSLRASDKQKKKRDDLTKQKNELIKELTPLRQKLIKYKSEYDKIEAELGPVKYLAEWIYGPSDEKILDKTVRYVILILILVFDPLAVFLLIAFNVSIYEKKSEQSEQMEFVEIHNHQIHTHGNRKRKRRRRRRKK